MDTVSRDNTLKVIVGGGGLVGYPTLGKVHCMCKIVNLEAKLHAKNITQTQHSPTHCFLSI